ncbi:MAG: hypothetical protein AB7S26_04465 [Sandaracinaceae bacterium]
MKTTGHAHASVEAVSDPSEAIDGAQRATPKVVFTQPPLQLARLVREEDGAFVVAIAGTERRAERAEDVDPALLREVVERGGRVLVETQDGHLEIAGVLTTRRPLEIDMNGDVSATVRTLRLRAAREVLLTTERAMMRIKGEDVELYGREVLARARDVAKILGRLISLN